MNNARAALAAAAILLTGAAGAAAQTAGGRPPDLRADAAILVDARNGEVLLAVDPDGRHSIASATKLMTALLAVERAEPGDVFTAPEYRALPVESKINLRRGERMRVDDLLEALMLESANDAAVAIAVNVAGSRERFVRLMNERARELGLTGTHYANPIGLDDPENYSTARDLATLARHLLENEEIARVVDMPEAVLESGARRRVVQNRNRLVRRHEFVAGVKTGHTIRAGYVLVGAATGRGAAVVSVVLGEPSEAARDADTLALLRHGIDQFRRVPVLRRRRELARAGVRWHDDREVELVGAADYALTVRRGERPRLVLDVPEELEGPLPAGRRVGTARVVHDGRTVHTAPVVTARAVPGAGVTRKVVSALGGTLPTALLAALVFATMLSVLKVLAIRRRRARA